TARAGPRESAGRGLRLLVGLMAGLVVRLVAGVVVCWPRTHTSPPDPLPSAQDDAGKDSGKQTSAGRVDEPRAVKDSGKQTPPPASLRLLEVEAARVKAGQEKMVPLR